MLTILRMAQLSKMIQVFFDKRCAGCRTFSRNFLCPQCVGTLELSRESASAVYLFEESVAASALYCSRKKKARALLVSFIHVRLDLLGWDIGRVMAKSKRLAFVADRLEKKLVGRDLLVIDLDPRLCLTRIELQAQPL